MKKRNNYFKKFLSLILAILFTITELTPLLAIAGDDQEDINEIEQSIMLEDQGAQVSPIDIDMKEYDTSQDISKDTDTTEEITDQIEEDPVTTESSEDDSGDMIDSALKEDHSGDGENFEINTIKADIYRNNNPVYDDELSLTLEAKFPIGAFAEVYLKDDQKENLILSYDIIIYDQESNDITPEIRDIKVELQAKILDPTLTYRIHANNKEIEDDSISKGEGNLTFLVESLGSTELFVKDELLEKSLENQSQLTKPVDYSIMPATTFDIRKRSSRRKRDTSSSLEPGEVKVSKTASPVANKVNQWDISLDIKARDKIEEPESYDIVLVIDTSGSMIGYGPWYGVNQKTARRMPSAKTAAKSFVNQLITNNDNKKVRIGIVPFSDDLGKVTSLTNNGYTLNNAIDSLIANGGTFTQAGIRQARAMLNNSDADNKIMVVLSDGLPTYSYKPANLSDKWNYDDFDYNYKIGNGGSYTEKQNYIEYYYDWRGRRRSRYKSRTIEHGESAKAEAGFAKNNGYEVWSIGLDTDEDGSKILKDIASPNRYYNGTPDNLSEIFTDIAGRISSTIKDGVVTDPMRDGFKLVEGEEFVKSQGSVSVDYNGDLTWNVGALSRPNENSDIKEASLTYRIEVTDDIFNHTDYDSFKENPSQVSFKTNGITTLNYKSDEGQKSIDFVVPEVKPLIYEVKKVFDGEWPEEGFDINVSNNGTYNSSHNLTQSSPTIRTTNLRDYGSYSVSENPGEDFEKPVIKINGEEISNFTVGDANHYGIIPISVTNKKKQREVKVKVKKKVTGNMGDKTKEFDFYYTISQDGKQTQTGTFKLKDGGQSDELIIPYGASLTIKESPVEGYTTSASAKSADKELGSFNDNTWTWTYSKGYKDLADFEVEFENNKEESVPTGIVDNNLPFISLLALSLGGLVSFAFFRKMRI